jgi:uncharacterized DUF497 family protein
VLFEWDPKKATQNLKKHGLSFGEAITVFGDPLSVTVHDPDHSIDEDRCTTFGTTARGRRIMISHAERGGPGSGHQRSGNDKSRKKNL